MTCKERWVTNHGGCAFPLPELPQYKVVTPLRLFLPPLQDFHLLSYKQRSKGPYFSLDFQTKRIRIQRPQFCPSTPCGDVLIRTSSAKGCSRSPAPVALSGKVCPFQGHSAFIPNWRGQRWEGHREVYLDGRHERG